MITLDERETSEALPFDRLIETLRQTFAAGCHVPRRHVHLVETSGGNGTVLIMPAWNDKYLGIKTVNVYPDNFRKGLPGLFSVFTLFDATTGRALAQLDGNAITSRRTAAASALAASYLARSDSKRHLIIGAGRVGRLLPEAYRAVFAIQQVDIWNRDMGAAESLAASLREAGLESSAVRSDLEVAIARADIVSTATLSTEPIVKGVWMATGSHLDLIGSFTSQMREADDDAFRGASLFVDTDEALEKSGDLLEPMSRRVFGRSDVASTLSGLCTGSHSGRSNDAERTVFKSVGTALEDLAAAIQAYEHCMASHDVSASLSEVLGPRELPGPAVIEINRPGSLSTKDDAGLARVRVEQDDGSVPISQHAPGIDREEGRAGCLALSPQQQLALSLDRTRRCDPGPVEENQRDCER